MTLVFFARVKKKMNTHTIKQKRAVGEIELKKGDSLKRFLFVFWHLEGGFTHILDRCWWYSTKAL